ncbi:hypothetical protein [Nocardia vaccinii]|uniref:hypothetical protein n=1 Tax=Nocardia vaccinii TaxID=1822 RepID=UPI0008340CE7|nr:hypothetical protein [Nocardia vaccinii]
MPDDVRTASQLWWGAVILGVVRLFAGTWTRFEHRHTIARNIYDQLRTQEPQTPMATYDLMVTVLIVLGVVFGLALAAAALAVVHQLRRGKAWARTLFDVAAVVLVIGGVNSMFGLGAISGTGEMLAGAAAILQAVLAAGAVFLCHRTESNAYFAVNSGRPPR